MLIYWILSLFVDHPDPDNFGHCVYQSENGMWFSADCGDEKEEMLAFACEYSENLMCGHYSLYYGECYKVFYLSNESQVVSFDEAEHQCELDCGHLASVHSSSENNYLLNLVQQSRVEDVKYAYIGIYKNTWTDGSSYDYNNYGNGNPSTEMGDCAGFTLVQDFYKPGYWTRVDCSTPMHYICKKDPGPCINTATPPVVVPTTALTGCGPQMFQDFGYIYSAYYPNTYSSGLSSCSYILTVTRPSLILEFDELLMDGSSTITIYDSITATQPMTVITNETLPLAVTSPTNEMRIQFNIPIYAPSKFYRWKAHFYQENDYVPNRCNNTLIRAGEEFASPDFAQLYPNNAHCYYNIGVDNYYKVGLNFTLISTEYSHDYIRIYDGPTKLYSQLQSYSGNITTPTVVRASGSQVLVTFQSDSAVNFRGFRATVFTY